MATETVSPFEAANDLEDADYMLDLISWIEDARQLVQGLQLTAEIDGELAARLKAANLPYRLSWEDDHATGLALVLVKARTSIGNASEVLRSLSAASRPAVHEAKS